MGALIPSFGGVIYTTVAFVVALSVIVTVHEFGHYIVGRWSGIKAEVFSLGFGPVLVSRVDRRGTRWQIAALPLGGYVRFKGDSDAASGRDDGTMSGLNAQERRQTMHGAPLWARAATVLAGPMFNMIFSIVLLAGLYLAAGVAINPLTVGKLSPLPAAETGQLKPGDQIIAVDGTPTPDGATLARVTASIAPAPVLKYRVKRDGTEMTVDGPYLMPPRVTGIAPNSAAEAAGLKTGDVITAVNGTPVYAFSQLRGFVGKSAGKPLSLKVWRDGQQRDVSLTPRRSDIPTASGKFETRWLIGITGGLAFEPKTRMPGLGEAVGRAYERTRYTIVTSLGGLYSMITGAISSCNLHGPIGIAETSGVAASQGAMSFLNFIAMLSTAVGLLNLFPVPVLDGGHLVFHAWEAVTGSPPSDRALRLLMGSGVVLILALMLFALSNDVLCP